MSTWTAHQLDKEIFEITYNGNKSFLVDQNLLNNTQFYMIAGTKVYIIEIAQNFNNKDNNNLHKVVLGTNLNHQIKMIGNLNTEKVFKYQYLSRDDLFGNLKSF